MAINELIEGYVSRQEAKEQGLKKYFTGKPCKRGHVAERTVKDCTCLLCRRLKDIKYNEQNKEKVRLKNKKQHGKNKLKNNRRAVENYYKNQAKLKIYSRAYYRKNKSIVNKKACIAHSLRRHEDINFYLIHTLRCRLNKVIKRNQKAGSAINDLGCSVEFLKQHLEQQFKDGMTWENRGKVWHIDHIEPLCSFDLTIREQLLIACHYTNLRPLFKEDNLEKITKDKKKSINKPDANYSCIDAMDLLKDE